MPALRSEAAEALPSQMCHLRTFSISAERLLKLPFSLVLFVFSLMKEGLDVSHRRTSRRQEPFMRLRQAIWAVLIAVLPGNAVLADKASLEDGLYEVHFRLELPHLEKYAIDQKTTICVDQGTPQWHDPPVPLLSQNDIFETCRIENVRKDSAGFSYEIVCPGRGSARAIADYVTTPNQFKSRVSIMQGAKNMTMTEVQSGRRIGSCNEPM